jgi:hypothetical protein
LDDDRAIDVVLLQERLQVAGQVIAIKGLQVRREPRIIAPTDEPEVLWLSMRIGTATQITAFASMSTPVNIRKNERFQDCTELRIPLTSEHLFRE